MWIIEEKNWNGRLVGIKTPTWSIIFKSSKEKNIGWKVWYNVIDENLNIQILCVSCDENRSQIVES